MEIELIPRHFPNVGVIEGQLPEDTVDSLWKLIEESRKQPEDMKPELAGNMEKEAEGYMVMFPSDLKHEVFPFYENDGERISISGNIDIV